MPYIRHMGAPATYRKSTITDLRQCSETALLRLVLRRDEAAWAEFIHRYRGLMYHCINKVVARYGSDAMDADADEVYSEVLVSFLENNMRKLRKFDPERGVKLGSWVGMLSVNAAHDYLRSAARRPWLECLDGEPEKIPERQGGEPSEGISPYTNSHAHTPLDRLLEKERWAHLESILADFSAKDRHFLNLYYNWGVEPAGITGHLAISLKTVYSKKHKIREHLRRSVRDAGRTSALRDLAAAA